MKFWIILVFFLFVTLRISALLTIPPIFDEMVQLYMARDIAQGIRFPLYFDGQQYMGPLESYVLAPFIRLFGFSLIKGRIFNELFFITFVVLFLREVRRLFDRETAFYLYALLSILPFTALFFTTIVGYGEVLTLAAISLVFLMKVFRDPKPAGAALGLGVVSALALWANSIFFLWLIPIALSLLGLVPSTWKKKVPLWFAVGFLVGFFPVWIHGFQTGTFLSVQAAGARLTKLENVPLIFFLFFARLRFFLSTYSFGPDPTFLRQAILVASFFPLTLFLFSAANLASFFLKSYRERTSVERAFYLFILLPVIILGIFYCHRDLKEDEGMRYFIPLVMPFAFVIAWQIRSLGSSFWKGAVLTSLAAILFVGSVESFKIQHFRTQELRDIFHFLDEKELRYGMSVNDPGYALNALGEEKILVTPFLLNARNRAIWEKVKEKGPQFFILEFTDPIFRNRLEKDPLITKKSFVRYEVFYGSSKLFEEILNTKQTHL